MRTLVRMRIRPMAAGDISQIMDIERESFPSMWPQTAYRRELQNKAARYWVVAEEPEEDEQSPPQQHGIFGTLRRIVGGEEQTNERILGFVGTWILAGDAHIVTIAVRESCRRRGIGERLLIASIETAIEYDQEVVTLEVRRSNVAAQDMYDKYGFNRIGLRKRYYTDNNEDAVIMTTPDIRTRAFRDRFEQLRALHREQHPELWS